MFLFRMVTAGVLLALLIPTSAWSASTRQNAYNACQRAWDQYRPLAGYKAMVAGVGSGTNQCFWAYGHSSANEAINAAFNRCAQKYGTSNCYQWTNSRDGHRDWVKTMIASGGSDGSSSRGSGGSVNEVLDVATSILGIVGGVAGATSGGNRSGGTRSGGGYVPQTNGYSQRGAFEDCAKVYAGAGMERQAAECRRRASNMNSLR